MKHKLILICIFVLTITSLSACGSSNNGYNSGSGYYNDLDGINADMGASTSSSYFWSSPSYESVTDYDSGYYSNASISGTQADYSYSFSAEGKTKKSKQYMIDYYEELQSLVNDNGGYIENVNNNYEVFIIDSDKKYLTSRQKQYKSYGQLKFTIQIPNENVQVVIDSLEKFCDTNKLTVTYYNQRVTNYESYTVVPDDTDIDYYYRNNNIITESELARRLKYADFTVSIYYYNPRAGIVQWAYGIREVWYEFWENVGEMVLISVAVALCICIVLTLIFIWFVIVYKKFKKITYKHRLKKPEYYTGKEIIIKDASKNNSATTYNSVIQPTDKTENIVEDNVESKVE